MEHTSPETVRRFVELYRTLGLQPLPSDPRPHDQGGRKKPLIQYAHLWDTWTDEALFDRFPGANIQVMLGVRWNVCVLDLDGPDAIKFVESQWPTLPRSWVSYHGRGDDSRHVWFRTPAAAARGKRVLWRGEGKHSAVELLCDKSLIVAPPSVHNRTGRQYQFVRGRSPFDCRLAPAPAWLWRLPDVAPPPVPLVRPAPTLVQPRRPGDRPGLSSHAVLSLIPVEQVARGWGLRFARGRPSAEGWHPVHDFNRDDTHPSAAFNVVTGRFWRPGMGPRETLSLFELGARLGHFGDWRECRRSLAEYYGVR